MAVLIELPGDVFVTVGSDGNLHCNVCDTVMCRHIQGIYKYSMDSESLWDSINSAQLPDSGDNTVIEMVMIPVSVALNQWVKVEIFGQDIPGGGKPIKLVDPRTGATHHVGYIFPGDGRNSIRKMIYEWFMGTQRLGNGSLPAIRCNASSHKPAQQQQLERHLREDGPSVGERWSLYFTGMCVPCNIILADASSFVPTL